MELPERERFFQEGGETPEELAGRLDEALGEFREGNGEALADLLEETEDREETLFRVLQPDFRPAETLQPGKRIQDFVIQRKIGMGGMGLVFEAMEDKTGRKVALKISRFEGDNSEQRDRALQREMEALSKLIHPNIAVLYRAGCFESQKFTFLAMELVQGRNLRQFVREKGLGVREVLLLFLQLVEAVSFIQSKGILHLDLKPSNVLVDEDGKLKLLDFGLSKLQHVSLEDSAPSPAGKKVTVEKMIGTFPYLAPEQVQGSAPEISTRTDVYQLGFILYELLLGRRPIEYLEEGRKEMGEKILANLIPEPRSVKSGFPKDLELIILKCLAKDPLKRYSGAAALLQDLQAYLGGFPVHARRPTLGDFLGKFVKRNRRMALFYALLFMISGVLGWLAIHSYVEAKKSRERVVGLERSLGIISNALEDLGPAGKVGRARVMAGALGGIVKALDQEAGKGDLLPEQEAGLRAMLGRHYTKIGFHKKALPQLIRALDLRRKLFGAKPNAGLAQSLRDLAFLYHAMSELDKSEPLHREALAMRLTLFPEASLPVCQSKEELAELLVARGRPKEALGILREGLFQLEQSPGGGPLFLRQLRNLARHIVDQGQVKDALALLKRGQAYIDGNPQEISLKDRFYFLQIFAKALCVDCREVEALPIFDRLEGLCSSIFGEESEEMVRLLGVRVQFHLSETKKGMNLSKARLAAKLGSKVYGPKHAIALMLRKVLYRQLLFNGFEAEGKAQLRSLIRDYRTADSVGKADRYPFFLDASSSLLDLGDLKKAKELLEEARPFFLKEGESDLPSRIFFHECVARLLYQLSRYKEAFAEGEKGLALSKRISAPRFSLGILGMMGLAQEALGNKDRAEAFFEQRKKLCLRFGIREFSLRAWRK